MPDLLTLTDLGRASLSALWLPVALWTGVALLAEAGLRLTRAGAPIGLPLRGALLAALPASVMLPPLLRMLAPDIAQSMGAFTSPPTAWLPELVIGGGRGAQEAGSIPLLEIGAGGLVVLAGMVALVGLSRLSTGAHRLHRLRRALSPASDTIQQRLGHWRERLGIRQPVAAAEAPRGVAPFTVGWRQPIVAVPDGLDAGALDAVLTHELAHVARADYAWHLAQCVLVAVCGAHPLVHVLARGLDLDRERAADTAVLDLNPSTRRAYADLLLAYASIPTPPFALGITPGSSSIKHRINAMTHPLPPQRRARALRLGRLLAALTLVLTAGMAVIAASPEPADASLALLPDAANQHVADPDTTVFMVVEEMPEMAGGLSAIIERVTYPPDAFEEGVEGQVIVQFVVTETGSLTNFEVRHSPDARLTAAALKAIQDTRFTPGRQGGETVKVQLTLPITFQLPPDED